ncbi:cell division protein FtsI/penicillin-binding protein 2 [Paenibacillus taihuensis]|uniref:Cell division protein FtsI/penicillin-binding protein 2 n=1 Tax=Paenibacillus taihuensis TaxID=1156355 RepID=A0A3D9RS01_9BACL|nr:penicillin-binding transpeptidase domain-containing protein [Paenibacillus taihuensis]REE82739.1 cell division protein FtsI/penicillin-binding protein 2 [Paenibacillus taihuensis]
MSVERRRNRQKRVYIVLLGMSSLLIVYMMRIAWLQLAPSSSTAEMTSRATAAQLKAESVAQRERELVLDSGRGDFYDRSGLAITGETYKALAVFPLRQRARTQSPAELTKLARALGVKEQELAEWMGALKDPAFWRETDEQIPHKLTERQLRQINELHMNGVRVLPYRNRYPEAFGPKHVIGYTSQHPELLQSDYSERLADKSMKLTDQTGGSGLERSLDQLLQGVGATSVSYFTNGADEPLHGLDLRLTGPTNPYYPLKVTTTLDLPIQNRLEQYVDKNGLKEGAVVVLDAVTGDIVSMISRPKLSVEHIGVQGTDTANHAIRAAVPGSIFKLVTEAAALEAGLTNEQESFFCGGSYGRYGLHCWKRGGHGDVTLQEALAGSCNVAFATIAERLTARQLMVAADQLGVGRQIGSTSEHKFQPLDKPLKQLQDEEAGTVFAAIPTVRDGGQLAQTGIGQRDVRMSPLQAANMMVTLLHRGEVREPRLVSEIRYGNGQLLAKLPRQLAPSPYGQISLHTTQTLLRGMEAVVAYGTGSSINDGSWRVAGKSGTAQVVHGSRERINHWFVGYGPVESPRYAVAVLAENRTPGLSNKATVLFRGVMDILAVQGQE